jgi:hypothetical protein
MAGHIDESPQFGAPSAPDRGNGPGSSTSYFSGVGEAWDSVASAAEASWTWTTSEASTLWTGTKEEAAHIYAEANKWGTALVGAKTWNELHHIANVILGPESFYLGICCGVVENLGEMAWGLVDLLKTLILAGLYEKLHGPIGLDAVEPSSMMLRFAAPVFDKILGKPMREADKKVRGMIIGVGKIVKEPAKFLGTAWTSTKNDYVTKWNQYIQFFNSGRAIDKFRAGELAGDALTQIVLTILAIISGVGAAVRGVQLVVGGVRLTAAAVIELTGTLSREAPELLEIAQGMKEADGAASTAEAAAKAAQKAEAAEAEAELAKAKSAEKPIQEQTNAQKGVFGEAKADAWMKDRGYEKLNGDPVQVGDSPKGHGIDGVWENPAPPPQYVITEAKYGSSRLWMTQDGRQMSDAWIDNRLNDEVGKSTADAIREADAEGNVQKWTLRVDENGNVTQSTLP